MGYIENPKTKGSGIICAIPQKGRCPHNCDDCFFQSGRSYLEPLDEKTPNMPSFEQSIGRVIRVNDGNDSNVDFYNVEKDTRKYQMRFFNTSYPYHLKEMKEPVVLTINPSKMTDKEFYELEDPIPKNLMFVRIRTNMWNMNEVVRPAVKYYAVDRKVPVVLTFMAYYTEKIPEEWKRCYSYTQRTLNSYWVIKNRFWEIIMSEFRYEPYVYSCSKIEGESGIAVRACARCGNCIREYFVTKERMRNE